MAPAPRTDLPATGSGSRPPRRILISAAEPSADLHGASLIGEVARVVPGVEFAGLGGPLLGQAGCQLVGDLTGRASMLLGTIRLAGRAWKLLGRLDRLMAEQHFDLGVLIDSPMLNLPLAKRIKRRGIPVLYYIAPQTWAWAEYRHKKLARRVDRLAVILPFEEPYFRSRGIRADYVGHPLFDVLTRRTVDQDFVRRVRQRGSPVVALLPGSRRQVAEEVLPGQLQVCHRIARQFKEAQFLLSEAGPAVSEVIAARLTECPVAVETHRERNGELLSAADLVLVASGTATLEVAYYHKPMIVMYNHSRWGYELIGRWLIASRYLSLPNIMAGRRIVPEFMPYYRSVDAIAARAVEMLSTPQTLARMSRELDELMTPLIKTGASANTACIVAEMLASADGAGRGHNDSS